jgi:hypothetical protein
MLVVDVAMEFGSGSVEVIPADRVTPNSQEPVMTFGVVDVECGIHESPKNTLFVHHLRFVAVKFDPN